MKDLFPRWRANFFTGLAVVLPAVISIAVVVWLFSKVSNITDALLFFVPKRWTHEQAGQGPMYWYWSFGALVVGMLMIGLIGRLTRYYFGKKMIQLVDLVLLKVPLLNKIYGALKQVNDAFTSSKKTAFKQAVLVEFPRLGQYSLGFITGEHYPEIEAKTHQQVVCVFVPTTPNPTSGFLILLPKNQVIKLEMSVADSIKFIMSLGAIAPGYESPPGLHPVPQSAIASASTGPAALP